VRRAFLITQAPIAALLYSIVIPAHAADLGGRRTVPAPVTSAEPGEAPDVPGGDIFGFTSGTDVGKVGDRGIALENSGAYGIGDGRWRGLSQKLEFSGTFVEN
jgi:hypothetical protein